VFTGIIELVGKVQERRPEGEGCRFRIKCGFSGYKMGESIAVNGVCLTVAQFEEGAFFEVDVSEETLKCSSLGKLKSSSSVNLERALCLGERIGGHLVTGHVDTTGVIRSLYSSGEYQGVRVSFPERYKKYLIEKGSIAIDGVSLTVNRVNDFDLDFEIFLIPHTLEKTNFRDWKEGSVVNLEFDLIGKYIERQVDLNSVS